MGELFLWIMLAVVILLIAPISLNIHSHLDVRENKVWFSVRLFNLIKLVGGYMQLTKEGLAIHLSKKKVVILPYNQMLDTRKKFDVTSGFQLTRLRFTVETSGSDQVYGVMIASVLQTISEIAFPVLREKYSWLKPSNCVLLSEQKNFTVSMEMVTVFNLIILFVAIFKKILEAFLQWIREKKSTASWKKQRSN